ncbi:hypothetical protein ACIBKY_31260 [Nonomuraea sp. NPDC050394]|uniref:hypothetical protein n=1 Tax=Nonomuraea sp. NPDC050394 TaxID=3364363 RepID=UPI0037A5831E
MSLRTPVMAGVRSVISFHDVSAASVRSAPFIEILVSRVNSVSDQCSDSSRAPR